VADGSDSVICYKFRSYLSEFYKGGALNRC